MTNREKYGEQLLDFMCKRNDTEGIFPGFADGRFITCKNLECSRCIFGTGFNCGEKMREWLNSEYVEPEIDWSKVPVDTKVLVRDKEDSNWQKRYFAGLSSNGGRPMAFTNGKTSWTGTGCCSACWNHIKLANPEDVRRYAKKSEDSK